MQIQKIIIKEIREDVIEAQNLGEHFEEQFSKKEEIMKMSQIDLIQKQTFIGSLEEADGENCLEDLQFYFDSSIKNKDICSILTDKRRFQLQKMLAFVFEERCFWSNKLQKLLLQYFKQISKKIGNNTCVWQMVRISYPILTKLLQYYRQKITINEKNYNYSFLSQLFIAFLEQRKLKRNNWCISYVKKDNDHGKIKPLFQEMKKYQVFQSPEFQDLLITFDQFQYKLSDKYVQEQEKVFVQQKQKTTKYLCCQPFFFLEEVVSRGQQNYVFIEKDSKLKQNRSYWIEEVSGLLNGDGGVIFLGIDQKDFQWKVKGDILPQHEQKQFKNQLQSCLLEINQTPEWEKEVKVDFVPVLKKSGEIFVNVYVTRVTVQPKDEFSYYYWSKDEENILSIRHNNQFKQNISNQKFECYVKEKKRKKDEFKNCSGDIQHYLSGQKSQISHNCQQILKKIPVLNPEQTKQETVVFLIKPENKKQLDQYIKQNEPKNQFQFFREQFIEKGGLEIYAKKIKTGSYQNLLDKLALKQKKNLDQEVLVTKLSKFIRIQNCRQERSSQKSPDAREHYCNFLKRFPNVQCSLKMDRQNVVCLSIPNIFFRLKIVIELIKFGEVPELTDYPDRNEMIFFCQVSEEEVIKWNKSQSSDFVDRLVHLLKMDSFHNQKNEVIQAREEQINERFRQAILFQHSLVCEAVTTCEQC